MLAQSHISPASDRAASLAIVVGLHLVAGAALLWIAQPVIRELLTSSVEVRMLSEQRAPTPAEPQPEPPKPLPMQKKTVQARPQPTPTAAPVIQSEAPVAADTQVMTAPPAPKEMPSAAPEAKSAPVAEAPLHEPRFDADYLNNPQPVYPRASMSLGEEGTVLLRVQVSESGAPLQVLLEKSSGFPRLDRSALEAVKGAWRFVAARRGDKTVVAWVLVPIKFNLSR